MSPFQGIVLFIVIYCQIIFAAETEVGATMEASPGLPVPVAQPPVDPVRAAAPTLELEQETKYKSQQGRNLEINADTFSMNNYDSLDSYYSSEEEGHGPLLI